MKVFKNATLAVAAVAACAAFLADSASAQDATAVAHVRGKVSSVTADSVVVKTRKGLLMTVKLAPTWHVAAMKHVDLTAIQPGSFIGTTTVERPDGTGRSLEVHIFPPGVKMGAGHYAWDLRPHSMMTNGDVGKVVASPKGATLEVAYPGGMHTVLVPPNAIVVETIGGTRDMVKPGAGVFLVAAKLPDGSLASDTVVVGEHGEPPPM